MDAMTDAARQAQPPAPLEPLCLWRAGNRAEYFVPGATVERVREQYDGYWVVDVHAAQMEIGGVMVRGAAFQKILH